MAEQTFTVTLTITNESGQHESMSLKPGAYLIGRADDCDIRAPSTFRTVSRHHARLTVQATETVDIEDLGSRAGVTVNGEIVKRQQLEDGDVVVLGDLNLRVRIPQRERVSQPKVLFDQPGQVVEDLNAALSQIAASTEEVHTEMAKRIVGQREIIRCVWAAILARGHCLMVGVPGLAKTLLVNTLAEVLQLKFSRIQFTPDLMPADIVGSQIISKTPTGDMEFRFEQGPIFTQLLLADEINRTPPKTQAALLQAMQEREVTVSRNTYKLGPPFCVIATQNPIEQEGTYPLPEAQQDRFLFSLLLDYPERDQERQILAQGADTRPERVKAVIEYEQILRFQDVVERVALTETLIDRVTDLVRATRPPKGTTPAKVAPMIDWGAGPRAGLGIMKAAKAFAAMDGRPVISEEDVKRAVKPVLRHRIGLNYRAQASKMAADDVIDAIVEDVYARG